MIEVVNFGYKNKISYRNNFGFLYHAVHSAPDRISAFELQELRWHTYFLPTVLLYCIYFQRTDGALKVFVGVTQIISRLYVNIICMCQRVTVTYIGNITIQPESNICYIGRKRTLLVLENGRSWCQKTDALGVRKRTLLVPENGHFLCQKTDTLGARKRKLLVSEDGRSWCHN